MLYQQILVCLLKRLSVIAYRYGNFHYCLSELCPRDCSWAAATWHEDKESEQESCVLLVPVLRCTYPCYVSTPGSMDSELVYLLIQSGQGVRPPAPHAGKKLVIRRNTQHADKSPLPLKLRCLKVVEEYHQQCRAHKEAQLRRQQV